MQLTDYLTFLKNPQTEQGVVCFSHKTYPALFFSHFQRAVREQRTVQTVDTVGLSFSEIQTQSSMSFLGTHHTLWLGNLNELDAKKQQQLLHYCATYVGPHTLWFFYAGEFPNNKWTYVQLPQTITLAEYQTLCELWYAQLARSVGNLKQLFVQDAIDLEFAIMLMQYHLVVGKQVDMFIEQWAVKLNPPEQSLFTLTTHFFGKQATPFFRLWKTIEPEYPAVFWSTFWSEQLFRAACVVEAMKANNIAQAKKLAYRLPFSFMQKDYKRVTLHELQLAHQFMYDYDVHIKNNGTPEFLDVMFGSFFTGANSRAF